MLPGDPWVHLRVHAKSNPGGGWMLTIVGIGEASCAIHVTAFLGPAQSPANLLDLIPVLEAAVGLPAAEFSVHDVQYIDAEHTRARDH